MLEKAMSTKAQCRHNSHEGRHNRRRRETDSRTEEQTVHAAAAIPRYDCALWAASEMSTKSSLGLGTAVGSEMPVFDPRRRSRQRLEAF